MNKNDIYIVIPAWNEETRIIETIKTVKKEGYKNIIVVDDCSTDSTYKVLLEEKDIYVLHHILNRGQGAALQTGTSYAVKQNAKYIVHFDADGQHKADEIKLLVNELKQNKLDIILGSRFLGKKAENIQLKKQITLKIGILFTFFTSGIMLSDTHNGFRAMTLEGAKAIYITMNRMEHASEILDLVKIHSLRYKEFPVHITYTEYSMAKGQKISNSLRIVRNIVMKKLYDILIK